MVVRTLGFVFANVLLAGCVVATGCSSNDCDWFNDNSALNELSGTWVLENQGVELFDCAYEVDSQQEWGCSQIVLEFPDPTSEDSCPHFCGEEQICLDLDDHSQSMTDGSFHWGEFPDVETWVFSVFSMTCGELVIKPHTVCWSEDIVVCCSASGEWRGREAVR